MRINSVKKKLKQGEVILMAFLCSHDVRVTEIMSRSGIDLLALDLEQNSFTDTEIVAIAKAASSAGSSTIIRTSSKDPFLLSHYMDLGVDGILSTNCGGVEEAKIVVDAVKYPPIGNRGISPQSPALNYGFIDEGMSFSDLIKHMNENTIIITTLETVAAVKEAGLIAKIPHIDSVQIGPLDLAASMGCDANPRSPEVQKLIAEANQEIMEAGSNIGDFVTSPDKISELLEKGIKIQLVGSDTSLLRQAAMAFGKAKVKANK